MVVFYFYLIVGLVLLSCELIINTFYLLVIGIACLLASIVALIGHEWLFSTLSAGALSVFGCIIVKKRKFGKSGELIGKLIGHEVEIVEIDQQHLRVFYSGTYWDAKLLKRDIASIKKGDKLKIVKVHGNILEID